MVSTLIFTSALRLAASSLLSPPPVLLSIRSQDEIFALGMKCLEIVHMAFRRGAHQEFKEQGSHTHTRSHTLANVIYKLFKWTFWSMSI